LVRAQRTHS